MRDGERKKGQKTWLTARQNGSSSGNLHTYKPELLFAHFIWQRRAMSVRPSISLTVCLPVTASVTECVCVCLFGSMSAALVLKYFRAYFSCQNYFNLVPQNKFAFALCIFASLLTLFCQFFFYLYYYLTVCFLFAFVMNIKCYNIYLCCLLFMRLQFGADFTLHKWKQYAGLNC